MQYNNKIFGSYYYGCLRMKAINVKIVGEVCGNGFDYNTKKFANEHELTGWVKSTKNNNLMCHVEGKDKNIKELKDWLTKKEHTINIEKVLFKKSRVHGFENFEELIRKS